MRIFVYCMHIIVCERGDISLGVILKDCAAIKGILFGIQRHQRLQLAFSIFEPCCIDSDYTMLVEGRGLMSECLASFPFDVEDI